MPVLGVYPLLSLLLHDLRLSVVSVGLAFLDQLLSVGLDQIKGIRRMSEDVWFDAKHGYIFKDNLREKNR